MRNWRFSRAERNRVRLGAYRFLLGAWVWGAFGNVGAVDGAEISEEMLPPAASVQVDFDRDIRPIFEETCFRCHGSERPKSGFRLDERAAVLRGGDIGVAVIPSESARSPLIHYVAGLVEDMEMPPPGKGEPLTREQIALLRAWIDQGAPWSTTESSEVKTLFSISPTLRWITVRGDERQFREHSWTEEGWAGGFQEFQLEQRIPGQRFTAGGRVYLNAHDYEFKMSLEQRDRGFARFGFEQYRRYYDDTGGYYEPFATNAFSLGRDLHVDLGRLWMDLGVTRPRWPEIVFGYEYQFKEGTKSLLSWSDVMGDPNDFGSARAIFPSFKDIDESTHIFKLDLSHEIRGYLFEDQFRAEFFELETRRVHPLPFSLGEAPRTALRYREQYDHFQAVNAFRVEKQLQDWLLVSGGYLFSDLDGDGAFDLAGFLPSDPASVVFAGEFSNQLLLDRRSHVMNFNAALGPWRALGFFAGVQSDWTREKGFGQGFDPDFPKTFASDRDRAGVEESFGVRYTGLPFTVLFAEARFQQEGIDHFERQLVEQGFETEQDFMRDTDFSSDTKEFRGGFSISPWRNVSLHGSYKRRLKQNEYDTRLDWDGSALPGNGYPAFIRERDISGDEVEAKLVVHWVSWLRTTFKYQLTATDYRTVTDSSEVLLFDPAPRTVFLPGGGLLAGNFDAHTYSVNATMNPWRRWYLSSTFSYTDSRMVSSVNGRAGVVPYSGEIWNVVNSANFLLNERTDWQTSYAYSRSNFEQNEARTTLPLGIVHDRHGLVTGITRRFSKNVTGRLQYGYFDYDEPSWGGANDYRAHAVMGTLSVIVP